MAALIEINGSGGGKVTNGELKEYETHIGEIPANTFVEIIKTVQFSEENPAASVQDTANFGFGAGSNVDMRILYDRYARIQGGLFFSVCNDYNDGQRSKIFNFSLTKDHKINMETSMLPQELDYNNGRVSKMGGSLAAYSTSHSGGKVYINVISVNADLTTEVLFSKQTFTFPTTKYMYSAVCATENMKTIVVACDSYDGKNLYAAAGDIDSSGIINIGNHKIIKTVTEFSSPYNRSGMFIKPVGNNQAVVSVGCDSGYWLIPCEVGTNNEISYNSGVLIQGNPSAIGYDRIHNFNFDIIDNLVFVTYAKDKKEGSGLDLVVQLLELNNLMLLKKCETVIPKLELGGIDGPFPAKGILKVENNLYCILIYGEVYETNNYDTCLLFFKIDNETIDVVNSVNLLSETNNGHVIDVSFYGSQKNEIIAVRTETDSIPRDILLIQLGEILHYITQSETKIDGITKTKATTEQAGKVWVLAPPAE